MEFLNTIKALIPDYAKDMRLNLDGAIARSQPARPRGGRRRARRGVRREGTPIVDAIRDSGAARARRRSTPRSPPRR